ncbi:MAG: cyclase family protein [Phycisphaerae bacterium]|nr:cyclase family protein [Phycisphaerae bacterium]
MIYDISPPITESLAVWPGDVPLRREVLADIAAGDPVTASALHATVHLGAHADAPSHLGREAKPIDQQNLEDYLGLCQVVHIAVEPGGCITPELVRTPIQATRVLFATGTYPDPTTFNKDFAALAPETIDWLHRRKVRLVGIDTPSVDLYTADTLPVHRRILRYAIATLEGLQLEGVPEGIYELIALPLKLVGFDASPVRAILKMKNGK